MKHFFSLYRDLRCPVGDIIGTVLLFVVFVMTFVVDCGEGLLLFATWLYGIVFASEIVPFFKRVIARKRKYSPASADEI